MNPKISILVSVYNASAYIEKCAESLFNQTFESIEFIFVNDVTPDDSIEKILKSIEKFPDRKSQIKIINHTENRGTSASRNTALDAAKGDYILIIDCDDYIEPDTVEELYKHAVAENADVVVSDFYLETEHKTVIVKDYVSANTKDLFNDFIVYDRCITVLWNKLIRRSLCQKPECRSPEELNFLDDKHVIARIYYYAEKVVKVDKAFYHYNKTNPVAVTQTRSKTHFENVLLYWRLFDEFLKHQGVFEQYKHYLDIGKIRSKVSLLIDTDSYKLRKDYSKMFCEEEKLVKNKFHKGQKLMLLLIQNKLFILAHLFHKLLIVKRDLSNL